MRCRTLGPPSAELDGAPAPAPLMWRKHLALVIYLARSPRRTRAREHLLALLWGEKPEAAARHSLNEALRVVRQHLGDDALHAVAGAVTLRAEAVRLDTDDLEAAVRAGDWTVAAQLAGGEFLEGFGLDGAATFEDWLAAERESWRRTSVDALVRASTASRQAGDSAGALALALRASALAPDFHDAVRARVRALAAADGSAPLLGRAEPLAAVSRAMAGAQRGEGAALAVVRAAAGMGRTRLLQAAATECRLEGWTVTEARAIADDRDTPWSGLAGLLQPLVDAPGAIGTSPASVAALGAVSPAWAARFGQRESAVPPGVAFAELVGCIAAEAPVLIVLDDAMWIDDDTAAALGRVLRDQRRAPVAVLLSTNAAEPSDAVDALVTRIGRDIAGCTVTLAPLDAAAVRQLAAELLPGWGGDQLDRLARRVFADSHGAPFFASELLRAVAAGLDLGRVAASWPAPEHTFDETFPAELPGSLVAAIRVNFRRLSSHAQAVVAAAAVLGVRSTEATLARAAALPIGEARAALDEAERQRWLIADALGYTFASRVARDVVAREMVTAGQRARMLAQVAEAEGYR